MSDQTPFNPLDHLFMIKRKEKVYNPQTKRKEEQIKETPYLPVQWRMVWLHETKPKQIIWEILEETIDLDRVFDKVVWDNGQSITKKVAGWARVRGRLTVIAADDQQTIAESTKVETAADFGDYVEKAGTGALGRCLALAGFGTQFASLEFGEELADRPVDSPVTLPINLQQLESLRKCYKFLSRPEPDDLQERTYQEAKTLLESLSKECRDSQKKAS
jgi:hypothetical protein